MSAVLTPTPAATTPAATWPRPLRLTVAEYRALGASPAFRGLRTLLIDGEVFAVGMPDPPHDVALGLVEEWVRTVLPVGHHARVQKGFDVGTRTAVGPDLAVVRGAVRDYLAGHPTTAVLVVEVADSSLDFDTTTKAELYASAGVPDYWVVDVGGRRLLVFRDPAPLAAGLGATAYRTRLVLGPADAVWLLAAPTASIRVADLLP